MLLRCGRNSCWDATTAQGRFHVGNGVWKRILLPLSILSCKQLASFPLLFRDLGHRDSYSATSFCLLPLLQLMEIWREGWVMFADYRAASLLVTPVLRKEELSLT